VWAEGSELGVRKEESRITDLGMDEALRSLEEWGSEVSNMGLYGVRGSLSHS
jgi:hypothetical protein